MNADIKTNIHSIPTTIRSMTLKAISLKTISLKTMSLKTKPIGTIALRTMALLFPMLICHSVYADSIFALKTGQVNWGEDTITVQGTTVDINSHKVRPVGLEYHYLISNGLAFGSDIYYQTMDLSGSPDAYASYYRYLLQAKYYFPPVRKVRFYAGGGFGRGRLNIHGNSSEPNAILRGNIQGATAGMKIQIAPRFVLSMELRKSLLDLHDGSDAYDGNNTEFFLLMSFNKDRAHMF